jgi:hypothetical protein
MLKIVIILSVWLLLNVLFVLIVVPARSRSRFDATGKTLAPAPIDKHQDRFNHDEPSSLRRAFVSLAMGALFVLASPLIALRDAIVRLWKRARGHET